MTSTRAGATTGARPSPTQSAAASTSPITGTADAPRIGVPVGPVAGALYRAGIAAQTGELQAVKASEAGWDAWVWKGQGRTGGRIELRNESHPHFDPDTDGRARIGFGYLAGPTSVVEVAAVLAMMVSRDGQGGRWRSVDVHRLLRPAGDHRDRGCPRVEDWVMLLSHARFRLDALAASGPGRRRHRDKLLQLVGFERHSRSSATVSLPEVVRQGLAVKSVPVRVFELNRHDGTNPEGHRLSRAARAQVRIGAVVQAVGGTTEVTVEALLAQWAPNAWARTTRTRRFGEVLTAFGADVASVLGVGTGPVPDRSGHTRSRPVRLVAELAERVNELIGELRSKPSLIPTALAPPI